MFNLLSISRESGQKCFIPLKNSNLLPTTCITKSTQIVLGQASGKRIDQFRKILKIIKSS